MEESIVSCMTMNNKTKKSLMYGGAAVVVVVGLGFMFAVGDTPAQPGQQAALNPIARPGELAPDFSLQGLDGETYTLSQFRGEQPVLIEFLAVWCPHCQTQTKVNQKIIEKNTPRGVAFLSINASEYGRGYTIGSRAPVTTGDLEWFRDKFDVTEPLLFDDGTVGQKFGLNGFPMFVLINREGAVVWQQSGEVTEALLQEQVDKVL